MDQHAVTSVAYEFNASQNETIRLLAGKMKILGWVYIIQSILTALFGVFALIALPLAGIMYMVITAVVLFTGIWTKSAASSFEMIIFTKGSDINHLMDALDSLRKLYNLQFWMLVGAIALVAIGVLVALFVGIDAMSTMEQAAAT